MDKLEGQAGAGDSHSVQAEADRQAFTVNAENQERECVVFHFPPSVLQAAQEERDVERVNHYPLYLLGKAMREIENYANDEVNDIDARVLFYALRSATAAVDRLLKGIPFPLGISKTAALELKNALVHTEEFHFTEKGENEEKRPKYPKDGEKIGYWDWLFGVSEGIKKFETLFSTEMSETATYFVPTRGIYSTAALIDFADQTFPPAIFGHVPDKAKSDWRAAGRCLAFSLLSATGFHVARAVEATLEVYYQLFTGKSGTLAGWHDYITALEKVQTSGAIPAPADKTLAELKQMKDDYRNPIVHPRVILTENDARMLFDNGESLIIAMAEEIKTIREAGGVQGSLAVVGGIGTPAKS